VICGFGRTGRRVSAASASASPDLMSFAKGVTSGYIPLGA
jgi:putrescine aminotransferase